MDRFEEEGFPRSPVPQSSRHAETRSQAIGGTAERRWTGGAAGRRATGGKQQRHSSACVDGGARHLQILEPELWALHCLGAGKGGARAYGGAALCGAARSHHLLHHHRAGLFRQGGRTPPWLKISCGRVLCPISLLRPAATASGRQVMG